MSWFENFLYSLDETVSQMKKNSKDKFEEFGERFIGQREMIDNLGKNTKNNVKKFQNDLKEAVTDSFPSLGKPIENIERSKQTFDNLVDAINPIKALGREFNFNKINIKRGDHLVVQRIGYTHHGLALDSESVIHYVDGHITVDSLEDFAGASTVNVKDSPKLYTSDAIISRAKSRLGESEYNLVFNNCEHFVNWCRNA